MAEVDSSKMIKFIDAMLKTYRAVQLMEESLDFI